MNLPDGYRFILIDNSLVKLFRSYDGAWVVAEQWFLNSGTTKIILRDDGYYDVYGYSGSIYTIRSEQGQLNGYTSGVYWSILKKLEDGCIPIREISLQEAIRVLEK